MDANTEEIIFKSPYGYIPTLYVCGIYVGLFGLATLLHCGLAIRYRLWWIFPTLVAGGLAETIGWAARLWSSKSPDRLDPFIMQMTTTIIAPSFMTAANFLILGLLISRLGPQYSRLSPKWYSIVFISADIGALVVQAVGGASAASAVQSVPRGDANVGAHIMLGGIFWQIAAMTVYAILALEFFLRVGMNRPVRPSVSVEPTASGRRGFSLHGKYDAAEAERTAMELQATGFGFAQGSKLSLMIVCLGLTTLLIYVRGIYRTVELINGWSGVIITTEIYFNLLDAMPITLALFTFIFLHPGWLLYEREGSERPPSKMELTEHNMV
ncbi:RTA1 like protein [Calocera cornea HHB12733]|uniref:RTA1 like protein n=1 Tax=Calocera cornea HHB12733 TaxID=1353952 RepID=A0A165IV78_9BASI|nr:RTA1 like protein [Calocera cornea HHB12733]